MKFSLRLSGEMAEQARQLAKARRSTPCRVTKDVLATAFPAALGESADPSVTPKAIADHLLQQQKSIDRNTRVMQSSVDFTAETLMLLRRISEELSTARDLPGKQALWRSVKKQIQDMRDAPHGASN